MSREGGFVFLMGGVVLLSLDEQVGTNVVMSTIRFKRVMCLQSMEFFFNYLEL